jgi:hypothetical protein
MSENEPPLFGSVLSSVPQEKCRHQDDELKIVARKAFMARGM